MKEVIEEICIVGSGMGGGTLALCLERAGIKPLLIEMGSEFPTKQQIVEEVGRPFGLQSTHALELGGGSNLWHGVVAPLDKCDFEGFFNNGLPKWPILYEEMIPYWSKALHFLGFSNAALQNASDYEGVVPLVKEIDYNNKIFKPKLFRVLKNPTRLKKYLVKKSSEGKIKLMKNSVVKSIVFSEDGHRVDSILVHTIDGDVSVKSNKFVICAGALNTPKIFLNSDLRPINKLVSNNIGKFLFDHPMGFLGKILFKQKTKASLFSDIDFTKSERVRIGLTPQKVDIYGNTNIYIRPALRRPTSIEADKLTISLIGVRRLKDLKFKQLYQVLTNIGLVFRLLINKFSVPVSYRAADLFFVMDQSPSMESQVTLSESKDGFGMRRIKVNWTIADYDLRKINNLLDSADYFFGAEKIEYQVVPTFNDWKNVYTSAAHHLGTMRMSVEYKNGVVDQNLAFHGVENLWVCDGSVIPSGGNANPSLTICALAIRLAEYFLNQGKK